MSTRRVVHFQCLKDEKFKAPEEAGLIRAGKLAPDELIVIEALKAPARPTMLAGATHVTIGGSGWSVWEDIPFKRELRETVIAAVCEFGIPTLGICFGAQFLAHVFGGRVIRDEARKEYGPVEVRRTMPHTTYDLLAGLPETLTAHAAHQDRITHLPVGADLLAHSQDGEVCQAFALIGVDCWGVQFHPEHGTGDDARVLELFFGL